MALVTTGAAVVSVRGSSSVVGVVGVRGSSVVGVVVVGVRASSVVGVVTGVRASIVVGVRASVVGVAVSKMAVVMVVVLETTVVVDVVVETVVVLVVPSINGGASMSSIVVARTLQYREEEPNIVSHYPRVLLITLQQLLQQMSFSSATDVRVPGRR
jgi:hypothetical protein